MNSNAFDILSQLVGSFSKWLPTQQTLNDSSRARTMMLTILKAEENKKKKNIKGRSFGDIQFWIATAGKAAKPSVVHRLSHCDVDIFYRSEFKNKLQLLLILSLTL